MNLADLKDQLMDRLKNSWEAFQESSFYIQLKEKYDDLSPEAQKVVVYLSSVVLVLILLMIPWSFYSSSQDHVASFEAKRNLMRQLYQLKRDIAQAPQVPNGLPSAQLKGQVQAALQSLGLNTEQIKGIDETQLGPEAKGKLIPAAVITEGVRATLWKINLTQFVDASFKLQKLHPSAKLLGIDMKSNDSDNHYYDVIFQVASFSVPEAQAEAEDEAPARPRRGSKPTNNDEASE